MSWIERNKVAAQAEESTARWLRLRAVVKNLPVFDELEPCPKCGSTKMRVHYNQETTISTVGNQLRPPNLGEYHPPSVGLLRITCERCKATDYRKPLDWKDPE